jgi:hypothetical protein
MTIARGCLVAALLLALSCAPALAQVIVAPRACGTTTLGVGGTAVTAVTGPANGGLIINPALAASQGISGIENAYVDMVGTPGSTDANATGTTISLLPGQSLGIPVIGATVVIRFNAATTGHKVQCEIW